MFDHLPSLFSKPRSYPRTAKARGTSSSAVLLSAIMVAAIVGSLLLCSPARAQLSPQIGGGMQVTGSTAVKSAGPGLFLRASQPITQEVSLAAGMAGTGYVLEGGRQATYTLDLEASAIVTLPTPSRSANYLMGGAGIHMPFGNDAFSAGPTAHLGIGRIWALGESTLFAEVAPTLWVRKTQASLTLPIRGGIIF